MRESNAREIAAQMLQTAICDALCSSDEFLSSSAREWLHLENLPTESQIMKPNTFSYVWACREVGINWYMLNKTLQEALSIKVVLSEISAEPPSEDSIIDLAD